MLGNGWDDLFSNKKQWEETFKLAFFILQNWKKFVTEKVMSSKLKAIRYVNDVMLLIHKEGLS